MSSPAFDFQGDLHQQGGAIIVGPGNLPLGICLLCNLSVSKAQCIYVLPSPPHPYPPPPHIGTQVHYAHFDTNRLDHMPINWLLQHAGVDHTVDFSSKPKIIHL